MITDLDKIIELIEKLRTMEIGYHWISKRIRIERQKDNTFVYDSNFCKGNQIAFQEWSGSIEESLYNELNRYFEIKQKKWLDTWTETRLIDLEKLKVPKNPTNLEVYKVIELCNVRIQKLGRSYDSYSMYIDNYNQQLESEKTNQDVSEAIKSLKNKLNAWKIRCNVT